MILRSDCSLRLVEEKDLEQLLSWRNSTRIRNYMYNDQLISWEDHLNWFERSKTDLSRKHLVFEYQGTPVGVINITQIDDKNKKCFWGFYLGDKKTPVGCGLTMGYFGLNYLFETLNIRKLCSEVFAFNIASIKYHYKLGFKQEGRFIEHIYRNGKYEDIISFALFDRDWNSHKDIVAVKCFGDE